VSQRQSYFRAEPELQLVQRLAPGHCLQASPRLQSQDILAPRVRQHSDQDSARGLQRRLSANQDVLYTHQFRQGLGQRVQTAGDHQHALLDRDQAEWTLSVAGQNLATDERTWLTLFLDS